MHTAEPPTEVVTKESLAILGLADPSFLHRMVREGKLKPSRKLPGRTGAYLFWQSDIEKLRDERAAAKADAAAARAADAADKAAVS